MDFFTKYNLTPVKVLKIAGLCFVGIVLLAVGLKIMGSPFNSLSMRNSTVPTMGMSYDMGESYGGSAEFYSGVDSPYPRTIAQLSSRNIPPIVIQPTGTTGNNAEDFEVTDYSASIETQNRDKTCKTVSDLKALKYVIFERVNESDTSCNYAFKVEHARTAEILTTIKALDPKELSENTYTIKRQLDDFTSEREILEKKRASIDETLKKALAAYDEITAIATRAEDAESLAKIIDSKIQIIERMTNERLNINEALDRISRAKAEQLDRLDYTYFYVSVYENKYIDGERLKDSWKVSVKEFIQTINRVIQDITINLLSFVLLIVQYIVYLFILLFVVKFGWRAAKSIWNK